MVPYASIRLLTRLLIFVSLLLTKLAAISSANMSLLTCASISLALFFPSIGADCNSSPSVGPGEVGVGCLFPTSSTPSQTFVSCFLGLPCFLLDFVFVNDGQNSFDDSVLASTFVDIIYYY